jgi:hypothetical protein
MLARVGTEPNACADGAHANREILIHLFQCLAISLFRYVAAMKFKKSPVRPLTTARWNCQTGRAAVDAERARENREIEIGADRRRGLVPRRLSE